MAPPISDEGHSVNSEGSQRTGGETGVPRPRGPEGVDAPHSPLADVAWPRQRNSITRLICLDFAALIDFWGLASVLRAGRNEPLMCKRHMRDHGMCRFLH